MSESDAQKRIWQAASDAGYTLWRNNVGVCWIGRTVRQPTTGNVIIHKPRRFHAGLCPGSSDLIGFRQMTITPDMVGQTVAVFTAVECKSGSGRLTGEQRQFISHVNRCGGIAIVAREPEDVPFVGQKK